MSGWTPVGVLTVYHEYIEGWLDAGIVDMPKTPARVRTVSDRQPQAYFSIQIS
jgi:hypothetical protein